MSAAALHRATRLLTVIVLALGVSATFAVAPAEAAARARTAPEVQAENLIFALHNEARANPGKFGYGSLPAVRAVSGWTDIRDVARSWADRQAADQRMSHNPDFVKQLCCWSTVGENVAYTSLRGLDDANLESASRTIFQKWMDSEGHRNNIMLGKYDQMGLGISIRSVSGRYYMYLTANFRQVNGTPSGSSYGFVTTPPLDTAACPDGAFDRVAFADTLGGTHAGTIDCMLWWGVITTSDANGSTFGQQDRATRAFMAAAIDRLAAEAGKPLPAATRDHFADDRGHRYEGAINRVVEAGIAKGLSNGGFAPDGTLSRAQMATFLAALHRDWLGLPVPLTILDQFSDDRGSVHEANINLVALVDIAKGTGGGTFSPNNNLTRGQLATFAANLANILVGQGVQPGGAI